MNIEVIELTDWIRPLALIVSFCILVAFDRKVWMSGEAIIVAGFGAGLLLFPASMLAYEVTTAIEVTGDNYELCEYCGSLATHAKVWLL